MAKHASNPRPKTAVGKRARHSPVRGAGAIARPAEDPGVAGARLFESTIGSPFDNERFELTFDAERRRAWSALDFVSTCRDSIPGEAPHLVAVVAELGTVELQRLRADRRGEPSRSASVSLWVEPGSDEDSSRIQLDGPDEQALRRVWDPTLTRCFHAMVRSLCDGSFPPKIRGLTRERPELAVASILEDGWGDDGASVFSHVVDDWDTGGEAIDLPKLLAAIERDEAGYSWGVIRGAGRTRLITPLIMDRFQVKLSHLDEPLWLATRWWLAIDVDPKGEAVEIAIRTDGDHTWDGEHDEDGDQTMADCISETGYPPTMDLFEEFLLEETSDDEEGEESG